jgi:predicted AlkP superfamily pyrophosphatase or phosphodiesterase
MNLAQASLAALSLVLTACAAVPPAAESAPGRAARRDPPGPIHHVLLITIDGMLPDAYEHPDAHGLEIPTLRWLVAHGASSDGALSVFPSVTYPSHTSMTTGVFPGEHGINGTRSRTTSKGGAGTPKTSSATRSGASPSAPDTRSGSCTGRCRSARR